MRWMVVTPGVASGTVLAPPSKSYTHRALIAGHLTGRRYRVQRPLDAEDTRATATGLGALGTVTRRDAGSWELRPARRPGSGRIRCGASGTTLRLLSAVAALSPGPTRFSGVRRLGQRPMEPLLRALRAHGVECRHPVDRGLPLTVRGPLDGGEFEVDGSESSQFISALLFVLPRLRAPSTLHIQGSLVSEPYVAATVHVLRAHGVRVSEREDGWEVPGSQAYRGTSFEVPGDASSAAYLWAAGALSGGAVTVTGVPAGLPQADLAILDLLKASGCRVRHRGAGTEVSGTPSVPFDVELTPSPDLYPLAGALAACIPGRSILRGAPQIVGKESDSRATTIQLVRRLGGRARLRTGTLEVSGNRRPTPVRGIQWDDHRLVMSAAAASLRAGGPARVGAPEAVRKSFPGFWSALRGLGVEVRTER